jgi:hypothetical protein
MASEASDFTIRWIEVSVSWGQVEPMPGISYDTACEVALPTSFFYYTIFLERACKTAEPPFEKKLKHDIKIGYKIFSTLRVCCTGVGTLLYWSWCTSVLELVNICTGVGAHLY